jgi:transcriptional regulator with AAA-type ATPase domain
VLLQAKLLSVIEEKRVRRLGAVQSRQLDIKFMIATQTDLNVRVTEGRFRPDLYHRLAVVILEIPPLRERGEAILVLARHFVRQYAAAHGLLPKQLSRDAEVWLRGYGWSGNVRELDLPHAIFRLEHALAQCRAADIPLYLPSIMATLGLAYMRSGQVTEALHLLDQVEVRQTPGGGGNRIMLHLGEGYLLAGRVEDAHRLAERLLALARDRKERGNQAWALWLLGEIAAQRQSSNAGQAETYYQQALALAEELGMRPLQAHCHSSMGTLFTQLGQRKQARAALAAAITLYRAIAMTFWLTQTEATLAQALHGH